MLGRDRHVAAAADRPARRRSMVANGSSVPAAALARAVSSQRAQAGLVLRPHDRPAPERRDRRRPGEVREVARARAARAGRARPSSVTGSTQVCRCHGPDGSRRSTRPGPRRACPCTLRAMNRGLTPDQLDGLLDEVHLATLATVRNDGSVLLSTDLAHLGGRWLHARDGRERRQAQAHRARPAGDDRGRGGRAARTAASRCAASGRSTDVPYAPAIAADGPCGTSAEGRIVLSDGHEGVVVRIEARATRAAGTSADDLEADGGLEPVTAFDDVLPGRSSTNSFRLYPVHATAIGDHRHDGRWPDVTEAGRARALAFIDRWTRQFQAMTDLGARRGDRPRPGPRRARGQPLRRDRAARGCLEPARVGLPARRRALRPARPRVRAARRPPGVGRGPARADARGARRRPRDARRRRRPAGRPVPDRDGAQAAARDRGARSTTRSAAADGRAPATRRSPPLAPRLEAAAATARDGAWRRSRPTCATWSCRRARARAASAPSSSPRRCATRCARTS